jgi:hypothetical protein
MRREAGLRGGQGGAASTGPALLPRPQGENVRRRHQIVRRARTTAFGAAAEGSKMGLDVRILQRLMGIRKTFALKRALDRRTAGMLS